MHPILHGSLTDLVLSLHFSTDHTELVNVLVTMLGGCVMHGATLLHVMTFITRASSTFNNATTKHKHCFLLAASSSTLEKVSTATKLPVARSHIHMS